MNDYTPSKTRHVVNIRNETISPEGLTLDEAHLWADGYEDQEDASAFVQADD